MQILQIFNKLFYSFFFCQFMVSFTFFIIVNSREMNMPFFVVFKLIKNVFPVYYLISCQNMRKIQTKPAFAVFCKPCNFINASKNIYFSCCFRCKLNFPVILSYYLLYFQDFLSYLLISFFFFIFSIITRMKHNNRSA